MSVVTDIAEQALANSSNEELTLHAGRLEDVRVDLLKERVAKYAELCTAREKYRHPKDKEYTDFDRKTMLEAHTSAIQAEYELVAGLEKLVAERLELIKLLMGDK